MANWIFVGGYKIDLDKAKLIAFREENLGNAFYTWEGIYRTKTGKWLFVGKGGAMSKYGRQISINTYDEGCEYELLEDNEVKKLLEEWEEFEVLEKYFADDFEEI